MLTETFVIPSKSRFMHNSEGRTYFCPGMKAESWRMKEFDSFFGRFTKHLIKQITAATKDIYLMNAYFTLTHEKCTSSILNVLLMSSVGCSHLGCEHAQDHSSTCAADAGRESHPPVCLHPPDQLLWTASLPPLDPFRDTSWGKRHSSGASGAFC